MGLQNQDRAMNAHLCALLVPDFQVEVQLDSNKHKQKSSVRRALFLDSQQPVLHRSVVVRHGQTVCNHTKIYLRVGLQIFENKKDRRKEVEQRWCLMSLVFFFFVSPAG